MRKSTTEIELIVGLYRIYAWPYCSLSACTAIKSAVWVIMVVVLSSKDAMFFPVVVCVYFPDLSKEEEDNNKSGFITEENTDGPTLSSW